MNPSFDVSNVENLFVVLCCHILDTIVCILMCLCECYGFGDCSEISKRDKFSTELGKFMNHEMSFCFLVYFYLQQISYIPLFR